MYALIKFIYMVIKIKLNKFSTQFLCCVGTFQMLANYTWPEAAGSHGPASCYFCYCDFFCLFVLISVFETSSL